MEINFSNTVIHLFGYPGVGKYTIAKEMARMGNFRLIDNHLINNPIFVAVGADGVTPLHPRVWDYCANIRETVLDAIVELADKNANFILTNYLTYDDEFNLRTVLGRFEKRQANYYPIFLHCNIQEHEKRVVAPERVDRMKDIRPESPELNRKKSPLWIFEHPNRLEFDISTGTAQEAAINILNKISEIQKG